MCRFAAPPTSPSRCAGPSLSALKGGEALPKRMTEWGPPWQSALFSHSSTPTLLWCPIGWRGGQYEKCAPRREDRMKNYSIVPAPLVFPFVRRSDGPDYRADEMIA